MLPLPSEMQIWLVSFCWIWYYLVMYLHLGTVNADEDKSESPAEWRSRLKPVANKWVSLTLWVSVRIVGGCPCLQAVFDAEGLCACRRDKSLCFNASIFNYLNEKSKTFISRKGEHISSCWTLVRRVWPSWLEIPAQDVQRSYYGPVC